MRACVLLGDAAGGGKAFSLILESGYLKWNRSSIAASRWPQGASWPHTVMLMGEDQRYGHTVSVSLAEQWPVTSIVGKKKTFLCSPPSIFLPESVDADIVSRAMNSEQKGDLPWICCVTQIPKCSTRTGNPKFLLCLKRNFKKIDKIFYDRKYFWGEHSGVYW